MELHRANGLLNGTCYCACGAVTDRNGRWIGRNSRRRTPDPAGADGTESSFRVQFTRFAEEIRQLVTAVFGGELDMVVTHVATIADLCEVPLAVAGENLARIKIDFWCCLDSYQQFLVGLSIWRSRHRPMMPA